MSGATLKRTVRGEKIELPVDRLRPGKWYRGLKIEENVLQQEMAALRRPRLADPVVIRKSGRKSFEIVAGEARWQAARELGLRTIPCEVRDMSDREARQIALLEKLKQNDLSPLDEADILAELMQEYGLRQSELASLTGRSKTQISRTIRISSLPEELKGKVREADGHLTRAQLIEAAEHPHLADWIITDRPTLREIRIRLARRSPGDPLDLPAVRECRPSRPSSTNCGVSYDEFDDGRGFRMKIHYDETVCSSEQKIEIIHTLKVALFLLGELDLDGTVGSKRPAAAKNS